MNISLLSEYMDHLPLLAKWCHDQWGYLSPGYTLEERRERLRTKASAKTPVPTVFIAMDAGKPTGTAGLVECDMDSRPHLTPWMSSVYVDASARRQGAGTALVARVVEEAKALGHKALYLWTPDKEAFYAKRGWSVIERTTYKNEVAVIMQYRL